MIEVRKKLNEFQQWPQRLMLLPTAVQHSYSSLSDDLCFAIGPCRFHDIDGHIGRLQEEPFPQSCDHTSVHVEVPSWQAETSNRKAPVGAGAGLPLSLRGFAQAMRHDAGNLRLRLV